MKTLLKLILSIALISTMFLFNKFTNPILHILIFLSVHTGTILTGIYMGKFLVKILNKSDE